MPVLRILKVQGLTPEKWMDHFPLCQAYRTLWSTAALLRRGTPNSIDSEANLN